MHIFEHTQQLATLLGMQMEKLLEQITDVKRSSQLVKESSPTMNTEPPLYELQQNMEVHQQTHHELEQVKSSLFQDYSMIRDFVYQIAKELEEGKSASTDVTACSRLDEMYNNHKV